MSKQSILMGRESIASRLRALLRELGPDATNDDVREAAWGIGIEDVTRAALSCAQNEVWPDRKKNYAPFRHLPVAVADVSREGAVGCPACGCFKSKIEMLNRRKKKGDVKRRHRCDGCGIQFHSFRPLGSVRFKYDQRRVNAIVATEKQCSKCKQLLPMAVFAKKKGCIFYASWCRECQNENRSRHQLQANLKCYGLSIEEYQEILIRQSHRCAICKGESYHSHGTKRVPLVFDHCHKTGAFRGLICQNCNRAIGLLGDDAMSLEAALDYLRSHESKAKEVAVG